MSLVHDIEAFEPANEQELADLCEPIRVKPDENSGVKWVALEDAIRLSTEPWIRTRIYRKLIDKLDSVELTSFLA